MSEAGREAWRGGLWPTGSSLAICCLRLASQRCLPGRHTQLTVLAHQVVACLTDQRLQAGGVCVCERMRVWMEVGGGVAAWRSAWRGADGWQERGRGAEVVDRLAPSSAAMLSGSMRWLPQAVGAPPTL